MENDFAEAARFHKWRCCCQHRIGLLVVSAKFCAVSDKNGDLTCYLVLGPQILHRGEMTLLRTAFSQALG